MYGAGRCLAVHSIRRLVEDVVAGVAGRLLLSVAGGQPGALHTGAPRGAAPAPGSTEHLHKFPWKVLQKSGS